MARENKTAGLSISGIRGEERRKKAGESASARAITQSYEPPTNKEIADLLKSNNLLIGSGVRLKFQRVDDTDEAITVDGYVVAIHTPRIHISLKRTSLGKDEFGREHLASNQINVRNFFSVHEATATGGTMPLEHFKKYLLRRKKF